MYSIEEFDKAKTKILKFIIYKRRTENEVKQKFQREINENLLEDIIEYLKQAGYINDEKYIEKVINNFKILKNLSIKEVKYKLLTKGLDKELIEKYIYENIDELLEYEINSVKNLKEKKSNLEEQEFKQYLIKKGYKQESIRKIYDL